MNATNSISVREEGLEPSHPFGHRNLNPARLPIPPLARVVKDDGIRRRGPLHLILWRQLPISSAMAVAANTPECDLQLTEGYSL